MAQRMVPQGTSEIKKVMDIGIPVDLLKEFKSKQRIVVDLYNPRGTLLLDAATITAIARSPDLQKQLAQEGLGVVVTQI